MSRVRPHFRYSVKRSNFSLRSVFHIFRMMDEHGTERAHVREVYSPRRTTDAVAAPPTNTTRARNHFENSVLQPIRKTPTCAQELARPAVSVGRARTDLDASSCCRRERGFKRHRPRDPPAPRAARCIQPAVPQREGYVGATRKHHLQ